MKQYFSKTAHTAERTDLILNIKLASVLVETFAILVTLMLFISYLAVQNHHDRRGNIFMAMLLTNMIALLCDLITWLAEGTPYNALLYTANFMVFSLGYVMTALFTAYLSCFLTIHSKHDRRFLTTIYVNCAIAVALTCVSLPTRWYFYVQDNALQYGSLPWLAVVYSFLIIMLDMELIRSHRSELAAKSRAVFYSYGIIPVISFIIQLFGTELTVTWLGSTFTVLLIYLIIHADYVQQLNARELELSENRSVMMLSQIRPHFLFNTLNTI